MDLQRYARGALVEIDLGEEGVRRTVKSRHLLFPVRKRSGELESDVINAFTQESAPVTVLVGTVTRVKPEEFGAVEQQSVVAAMKHGLEFVARGIHADLASFLAGVIPSEGSAYANSTDVVSMATIPAAAMGNLFILCPFMQRLYSQTVLQV